MKRIIFLAALVAVVLFAGCERFTNKPTQTVSNRVVVISPIYNEIIWALGAQDHVVGVDLSSTYPPEIKNVATVGYHRALSAEGILSLHPDAILSGENDIGPPQVVEQIQQLNIPVKSFAAKNDSPEGTKALIREIGEYFGKQDRAEELCRKLDEQMAASLEAVKQFTDKPRIAVIHFGRASNVYLVVGKGGGGDGGGVGKMIEWAGGDMAVAPSGMQRMTSPEILAQANPDVILLTDYGYDRLGGSIDQIKELPGVAATEAAKSGRIFRVEENQLNYLGPRTGENIQKVAAIIHQK
jgi:iron complex transport system substrate-binding protein